MKTRAKESIAPVCTVLFARIKFLALAVIGGFISLPSLSQPQIPTGAWRTHFSYNSAEKIEFTPGKIYCSSQNGLFHIDLDDNSLHKLSKLNGLSDTGIGAMKYIADKQMLALVYQNGNMDFISQNGVKNLNALKKSQQDVFQSGSGSINVTYHDHLLYISSAAGITVVDLNLLQIKENYRNIGPGGQEINAYETEFFRDSIFVASSAGILAAPLNGQTNLVDYNHWSLQTNRPILGILTHQEELIAYSQDSVFSLSEGWKPFSFQPDEKITNITSSEGKLLVCLATKVAELSQQTPSYYSEKLGAPAHALSRNGVLWIADRLKGLMHNHTGEFLPVSPNGPYSDLGFEIVSHANGVSVLSGGTNELWEPVEIDKGFYHFTGGSWTNYNALASDAQKIPGVWDILSGAYHPITGATYFASFGDGILCWKSNGSFELINEYTDGSTLKRNSNAKLLVPDVTIENEGIWILNYGNTASLHHWDGHSGWQAFEPALPNAQYPIKLVNADLGHKWMILDPNRGGGILVFNPNTLNARRLSTAGNNGGLPSNHVTALALDLRGEMWVGTVAGIAYFQQPFIALQNESGLFSPIDAFLPVVENNILLRDQHINDVMVDPGNRKWIATNQGVWVVQGSGGEVFAHFTEENSPLPSNRVQKLEIIASTGEVFFLTEKGIVSFRTDATSPSDYFSDVKIFPNPVYPRNNGLVTLSGLLENSVVKVTDVTGNLVWETRSFGGTATWDSAAFSVNTGIYLVFATDDRSMEKFVGKILVVK